MRPTQEWKQAGAWPVSRRGKAEDALLGLAREPVEVGLLVRAGRDARAPGAALLLVDQHDAVLAALVQRAGRTGGHAARVQAVVADARQVEEHQPLDADQLHPLLLGQALQVRIVFGVDRRAAKIVVPVRARLRRRSVRR